MYVHNGDHYWVTKIFMNDLGSRTYRKSPISH